MIGKFISEECDKMGTELIQAYGALATAYDRANMRYTEDAKRFINIAMAHLDKTGIDKEDLESITNPLIEVIDGKEPKWQAHVGIASRIDTAQEEILIIGPNFIAACECSKRKAI